MRAHTIQFIICFLLTLFLSATTFAEEISLHDYCVEVFEKEGFCPKEMCDIGCVGGEIKDNCVVDCKPKPCTSFKVDQCLLFKECEVLTGCDEAQGCYLKQIEPECGELAYAGKVECCEGFIKRCGIDFFDGRCDMVGLDIQYRLPICVPCGNGICNQFENHCNCPEDCKDNR